MAEKKELPIHSSAAEYLTFVASTGESDASFEMRYEDENIWLTQKMMAALYDVTKQTDNFPAYQSNLCRRRADTRGNCQEILDSSNRGKSTGQPKPGPLQSSNDHCRRL